MRDRKKILPVFGELKEGSIKLQLEMRCKHPRPSSSHILLANPHFPSHVWPWRLYPPTASPRVPANRGPCLIFSTARLGPCSPSFPCHPRHHSMGDGVVDSLTALLTLGESQGMRRMRGGLVDWKQMK